MRTKLLVLAAITLTGAVGVWLDYSHRPNAALESHETKQKGKLAPEVRFEALEGNGTYALRALEGKTVFVNFWATWCAPCVEELPALMAFAERHPERLVMVLVSVDAQAENAQAFLRRVAPKPMSNVIAAWDRDKRIAQDVFQTIRYPESVIIGPDQRIAQKIVGAVTPKDVERLDSELTR